MKVVLEMWQMSESGDWEKITEEVLANISSTTILNVSGVCVARAGEGVRVWIPGGTSLVFYGTSGQVELESGAVRVPGVGYITHDGDLLRK
jgi:hypothetical protein